MRTTDDDKRVARTLERLGVDPLTIGRLHAYAQEDDNSLRDQVRYVLSAYYPAGDLDAPPDEV